MNKPDEMIPWKPRHCVLPDTEIHEILGTSTKYPVQFHVGVSVGLSNVLKCIRHAQVYAKFNERNKKQ